MPESRVRSVQYVRDIPEVSQWLNILDKKGQGTFASVFAVQSKIKQEPKKTYALKMLIPTVDVRRIENEVRILRRLGGKNNVIKMHTAWRVRDLLFILMPFIHIVPFSDYYLTVTEEEISRYMYSLLSALAYIHRYKIIHRDVKPTNFLLDQRTKRFFLVDFGLAHSEACGDVDDQWEADCDKFDAEMKSGNRKRLFPTHSRQAAWKVPKMTGPMQMHVGAKPNEIAVAEEPIDLRNSRSSADKLTPTTSSTRPTPRMSLSHVSVMNASQGGLPGSCVCGLRLTICRGCRQLPRLNAARRGGTLGFRPPEVMMRYVDQTTAVDTWAAGVIFLSFLSGRYPFIKVDDDLDVLHAFTHLLGYERMQACAKSLGRRLLLDPRPPAASASESPSAWLKARCITMRRLEKKLVGLPPLLSKLEDKENQNTADGTTPTSTVLSASYVFTDAAYDLAARLLDPNPGTRISASEALRHPFLRHYRCKNTGQRDASSTDPAKQQTPTSAPVFRPRAQFC